MKPVEVFLTITAVSVAFIAIVSVVGWADFVAYRQAFLEMKGGD